MSDVEGSCVGMLVPGVVYGLVLVLHLVLPAQHVRGYVRDPATGQPLRYRLNGVLVLGAVLGLWAGACAQGWLP
ncbi:MAG: hypothetical protein KDK70_38510, partial [Myxococcales bacterium]|nr:hypothetical protein [Myxococcales bacterium]